MAPNFLACFFPTRKVISFQETVYLPRPLQWPWTKCHNQKWIKKNKKFSPEASRKGLDASALPPASAISFFSLLIYDHQEEIPQLHFHLVQWPGHYTLNIFTGMTKLRSVSCTCLQQWMGPGVLLCWDGGQVEGLQWYFKGISHSTHSQSSLERLCHCLRVLLWAPL